MNKDVRKHSIQISCTNILGLNKYHTLGSKMAHIMTHLDTDVKILVATHADENTIGLLRNDYKIGGF